MANRTDAATLIPGPSPMRQRATGVFVTLAAAHELLVRIAHQAVVRRRLLNATSLAKDYLMVLFAGAEQEMFVVVFLDAHIRVIDHIVVAGGSSISFAERGLV